MKKTLIFFVFTCVMGLMFTTASAQEVSIPAWIKNNAGWWANDQIPDTTFVDGIEFLIEKEIIVISDMPKASSEKTESIPAWVKNNAGWWANDQIGDETFVNGLEYLIKVGIIVVESSESLKPAYFAANPSDVKLFDTTSVFQSAYSKTAIIHYMETTEVDADGKEFNQIWIEVHSIIGETIRFSYLKLSETVIDEYDDVELLLIEGLTKSNNKTNPIYLYVEESENNRMLKHIENDQSQIFKQIMEPRYILTLNESLSIHQFDYQVKDEFSDVYKTISITDEANKTIVIVPTFTASAYSPNGFYDFYRGDCDETCLTTPITNSIQDFGFTSSVSAVKILDLLGYDSITDRQLHVNPAILDEYDSVIVLHNEYVSRTMFNAITAHDNVIFLYPNALYAQVNVDTTNDLITLVRGHNYPENHITNGFDWKNENTHPYEYDTECQNWEFYPTKGTPNGYMLNCYPENIIWKDELFLKTLKDLVS